MTIGRMTNKPPLLIDRRNQEGLTLKGPAARRRGRPSRDAMAMPREEILRRAFNAFASDGYDGVSLRSLAAACGISDSLISHHFGSKQRLWEEAADSMFQPLYDQLLALLDALAAVQGNNAVAVLQNNLPQALKLVAADPVMLQFLFRDGEGDNPRGEYLRTRYVRPYLARLDALFAQAQDAGEYRRVSPASRHVFVFGLMRSLVMPGLMRAELAPHLASPEAMSAYIDEATALLYSGLIVHPHEKHLSGKNAPTQDAPAGERS